MPQHIKVLIAGICSLVLTVGINRFAYTPLLQIMQDAHVLNDAIGGWLATFNYMGYLTGTLIAASISDLKLKDLLYRIFLVLAVITTLAMAWTENWVIWAILRYIGGVTSAGGLILASGLILNWFLRHDHKMQMGVHFGGIGIGIVLSALAVEWMSPYYDWNIQWEIFAFIGLLIALPAWFWLPRPDGHDITKKGQTLTDNPPSRIWLELFSFSYFCVGIGYVVYATFLVVIANNQPELKGYGNWAWLLVGIMSIPCCVFWEKITDIKDDLSALIMAYSLMTISILIVIFDIPLYLFIISAILYGGSMVGIVSMTLTLVGKLYPTRPAKPMGRVSVYYAMAQIIAPAISGYIAEETGRYTIALAGATVIMIIGLITLFALKQLPRQVTT